VWDACLGDDRPAVLIGADPRDGHRKRPWVAKPETLKEQLGGLAAPFVTPS
jgi:hypothetical protein